MAKNKKGKTGGKRSTPQKQSRQNKGHARNPYDSDSDDGVLDTKAFSLKDTARASEHPRSFFSSSGMKLRNQAMSFVPSSDPMPDRTVEQNKDEHAHHDVKQEAEEQPRHRSQFELEREPNQPSETEPPSQVESDSPRQITSITPQESDSAEDRTQLRRPTQPIYNQSPAEKIPSSATSSDDEVVFGGRSKAQIKAIEAKDMAKQPRPARPTARSIPSLASPPIQAKVDSFDPSNDFISLNLEPANGTKTPIQKGKQRQKKRKRSRNRHAGHRGNNAAVDAALEDYMENMKSNDDDFAGFHIDEACAAISMDIDDGADKDGWATEDLDDFDNMSTSDEVMEAVSMAFSKRLRPSGMQYLLVREGQEIDEARWILASSIPLSAVPKIQAFEAEEEHIPEVPEDDDDDDSEEGSDAEEAGSDDENASFTPSIHRGTDSSIDPNDALSSDDSYNDEKDLRERHIARMNDEHIARLYAKQESLGLNSNELLLFDGAEDYDLSDPVIDTKPTRSSRKRNHNRNMDLEGAKRPTFFASDDEMMLDGDDYGLFDPMDRESHILVNGSSSKRKGKGKASGPDPLDYANADPEMIDQLRSAWASDRKTKAAKKADREEARHAGLLGKGARNGRPDLKARYASGISFTDLSSEFEDFLFGDAQQMSLPPMGKRERKIIHELAGDFGLKSKSQGSGLKRFSVLFKTRRSVDFDEELFARFAAQAERRFLPSMGGRGMSKGKAGGMKIKKSGAGGFGGKIATGYRDGEVVGRGASELGQENKGRAMLEKMGWSKGMALGTVGSGGILMPIEHIVKNSKAGLG